jgi:phage pi2 protein 07
MNLCQVYVPLVHQKPNDSTRWSFDSRDMSLEFIMAEFSKEDTTNDGEVSSFLNLMA